MAKWRVVPDEEMAKSKKWRVVPDEELSQNRGADLGKSLLNSIYQGGRKGLIGGARKLTAPIMESGLFGPALAEQSRKHGQEIEQGYNQAKQENPNTAGLFNIAGQAPYWFLGGKGAGKLGAPVARAALNEFRPSTHLSRMGESYSPEMAERALSAGQTPTPLGSVIGSPQLQKIFENKLTNTEPTLNKLEGEIQRRGEGLLGQSVGKDPNEVIGKLIKSEYKKANDVKNSLYKPVNELSKKEGLKLRLPTASRTAQANLKALEDSPMLSKDADFAAKVRKLFNVANPTETRAASTTYSPVLDASGSPIITGHTPKKTLYPSIVEAKEVANKLYSQGKRLMKSPDSGDRATGGLYSRISKEIRDDVRGQISKKGSPELKKAYEEAEKNYKDSFAHYLDKEIYPYTGGDKDTESLVRAIIKPSKVNDRYRAIQKINKILPEGKRGLLGDALLQSAVDKHGNFSINELNKILRGLGRRQYNQLFSPEKKVSIKDYEVFTGMNKEALQRMFNPKTGARGVSTLEKALGELKDIGMGGLGYAVGGGPGAIALYGLKKAYPAVYEKIMHKWLTDPKMRDAILKRKFETGSKGKSHP